MMRTSTDVTSIARIEHDEAMRLAETEYRRLGDVFAALQPDDWTRPTDCTLWDVRTLAGHVVGMMRGCASMRVFARQQIGAARRAKKLGGPPVDQMTAIQVEALAASTPAELVAEYTRLVPKAVGGRRRIPRVVRRKASFTVEAGSITEKWTLGYLMDVIITRDTWLHRVADVSRAIGAEPVLTADHDGRIVADVVAEWARRHGTPFTLQLTGPLDLSFHAGGGENGEHIEIDTVEFCRILSGRATGTGLLTQEVPF